MAKRNFSKPKGLTLLEIMLALAIFTMLLGLVVYIYTIAAKSWLKVKSQIDVKHSAQITMIRIQREIRGSAINSVMVEDSYPTAGNQAISFMSSYDDTSGRTNYDENGKMKWSKVVFYYIEKSPCERSYGNFTYNNFYQLLRRELDIKLLSDNLSTTTIDMVPNPPDGASTTGATMFSYLTGVSGGSYLRAPNIITRNITSLKFTVSTDKKTVAMNVSTGKPANPFDLNSAPRTDEKLTLKGLIYLRNSN
jgi:prepilin-type N-terminal cleavage/methylation domain-containing protein